MFFDAYPYVACPALTGNLTADVRALLDANGRPKTFEHALAVSEVNAGLASRFGLDAAKCRTAGLLHDISAVLTPTDMLAYAQAREFPLCEAELRYNFLLHQRISRIIAQEHFGVADDDILSPIECHTTLRVKPAPFDMALFITDKLAWDQEGTPPYYDIVRTALEVSLEKACLVYMDYMVESGRLLCPHVNWTAAHDFLRARAVQPRQHLL